MYLYEHYLIKSLTDCNFKLHTYSTLITYIFYATSTLEVGFQSAEENTKITLMTKTDFQKG